MTNLCKPSHTTPSPPSPLSPLAELSDTLFEAEIINVSSGTELDASPKKKVTLKKRRILCPRYTPPVNKEVSISARISPISKQKTPALARTSPQNKQKAKQATRTSPRGKKKVSSSSSTLSIQDELDTPVFQNTLSAGPSETVLSWARTRKILDNAPAIIPGEELSPSTPPWYVVTQGCSVGFYSDLKQASFAVGPCVHGRLEVVPTEAEAWKVFSRAFMRTELRKFHKGAFHNVGPMTNPF